MEDKGKALGAIEIYKNLNLAKQFEVPMRFKRIVAYLSYIVVVFYVVAGIYRFKVAPTFMLVLEDLVSSMPDHLILYQDYGGYFVLVVSVLLALSLLIGFRLKKIFGFDVGVEKGAIMKFLVFRNVRESYSKVVDILQFPILPEGRLDGRAGSPMIHHLHAAASSGMCVATEMRELLESEMRLLIDSCEKQMKYLSVSVALIIIAAIFFFLIGVYSPIFILGETV